MDLSLKMSRVMDPKTNLDLVMVFALEGKARDRKNLPADGQKKESR